MKKITFFLFFLGVFPLLAEDLETLQPYTVISESFDARIPEGKSRISGTVYYGLGKEESLIGATIFLDEKNSSMTDLEGRFTMEVPQTTEVIFVRYLGDNIRLDQLKLKSQHHYRLEVFFPQIQDVILKPVIYAYSDQVLEAKFELNVKGRLTFTYPQIPGNSWEMKVQADGMLKDPEGKSYPYLFWEGESESPLSFQGENPAGNFVESGAVISFLENSLTQLGFNAREKTDFITFWGPRMIKHDRVFVQFLIDEDYDQIATLEITPKPDHLRRVYLLFQGTDKNFEYERQSFSPVQRSGFTVLEWGGTEVRNDEL